MDTRKIIDFASDDNAKEMRAELYASIYDRVSAAFESKRQEIAGSLLGMPLSTEEFAVEAKEKEDDDKEDDEGHEDAKEDKKDCDASAKKEVKKHEKNMHGKDD